MTIVYHRVGRKLFYFKLYQYNVRKGPIYVLQDMSIYVDPYIQAHVCAIYTLLKYN